MQHAAGQRVIERLIDEGHRGGIRDKERYARFGVGTTDSLAHERFRDVESHDVNVGPNDQERAPTLSTADVQQARARQSAVATRP